VQQWTTAVHTNTKQWTTLANIMISLGTSSQLNPVLSTGYCDLDIVRRGLFPKQSAIEQRSLQAREAKSEDRGEPQEEWLEEWLEEWDKRSQQAATAVQAEEECTRGRTHPQEEERTRTQEELAEEGQAST
jgi:hypothetical protein